MISAYRKPALIAPVLLMLTACGDDLDSRNAAAGTSDEERELIIERPARAPAVRAGEEGEEALPGFYDEESESQAPLLIDGNAQEETITDAAPDDLIDRTEGFAPVPMDNAAGYDPTPRAPGSVEE